MARPADTGIPRDHRVTVRMDSKEAAAFDLQRQSRGGMTAAGYVRHLIQQDAAKIARERGKLS